MSNKHNVHIILTMKNIIHPSGGGKRVEEKGDHESVTTLIAWWTVDGGGVVYCIVQGLGFARPSCQGMRDYMGRSNFSC